MKTTLIALGAALSLSVEAASLTVKTTDVQVAQAATLAFGCFQGPDLHLRFERVPQNQQIPERADLEVRAGNQSHMVPVMLRAFKLGETQDVGATLSRPAVMDLIRTAGDNGVTLRIPGLAVPVSAQFDSAAVGRLSRAIARCR